MHAHRRVKQQHELKTPTQSHFLVGDNAADKTKLRSVNQLIGDFTAMQTPDYNSYCKPFVGQRLRSVELKDYSWFFVFADELTIVTESPWRFLTAEGIIVTSEDHGHQFGLPALVDAAERVLTGISSRPVVAASITLPAADLIVDFGSHIHLQFFQMSCGYESWRLYVHGHETICTGGGDLAYFKRPVAEQ